MHPTENDNLGRQRRKSRRKKTWKSAFYGYLERNIVGVFSKFSPSGRCNRTTKILHTSTVPSRSTYLWCDKNILAHIIQRASGIRPASTEWNLANCFLDWGLRVICLQIELQSRARRISDNSDVCSLFPNVEEIHNVFDKVLHKVKIIASNTSWTV